MQLSVSFADELPTDNPGFDNYASGVGSLITVIVVLALIVGLIVLVIRFLSYKNNSWFQGRTIRHLGGISVGQNKSVQLVKVGNSVYVVGVGNDVQLLQTINDQAEVEAITEMLNTPSPLNGRGIVSYFQRARQAGKKLTGSREDSSSPEAESFQELFHAKMQQVGDRSARLKQLLEEDEAAGRNKL